jgi:hypothetical protein
MGRSASHGFTQAQHVAVSAATRPAVVQPRPMKAASKESSMSKRMTLITAALALAGALGGGAAQAGSADLQWSIVIGTPVYTRPVPVVVQPWPVYRPGAREWASLTAVHARRADLRATRWDRDGDGIPNRYDRLYNPRWDGDADGIPKRHDRHPGRGGPGR